MRDTKSWVSLLLGLLALCVGPLQAQEVGARIQALEKRLDRVERQNTTLRHQLAEDTLSAEVTALMEKEASGTTVNSAANPIVLTGAFRIRSAWTIGNPAGSGSSDLDGGYTDARIRLGLRYELARELTAFVELQSHFTFGDATSSTYPRDASPLSAPYGFFHGEVAPSVALYQAWIDTKNLYGIEGLSNRTGRMEIVLGNQFQFGNSDWFNGFTFDGSRWTLERDDFRLVGLVLKLTSTDRDLNQTPSVLNKHDDNDLYGIYFTLKSIEDVTVDLYWFYSDGTGSVQSVNSLGENLGGGRFGTNAYFSVLGARVAGIIKGLAEGLDYNVEAAYETGTVNGSSSVKDVSGVSIEAELGLNLSQDSKLRLYVRGLFAEGPSGNDSGYIPLYPNRHSNQSFRARYGIFDLLPMTNVLSLQGGASFNPDPNWTVGATLLWATTDESNTITANTGNDDYGFEGDLWAEYRYSQQLTLGAGLAVLFPDDELVALTGLDDSTQYLIYLQARLLF